MVQEHSPMRTQNLSPAQKRQNSLMADIKRALEGVVQRIDLFQHLFPTFPPTFDADDIVVLLLGETGSGRTTFIRNFTGQPLPAGSSLECDTSRIEFAPCSCPEYSDRRIVFIDTPGFNHKNRKELSDTRVLQLILTWFMAVYRKNPAAILYFYDMNAARLHCRLEDIARRLPYSPVILTTTMWDDLPDDARDGANAREQGLKTLFETNLVVPAQSKPHPVVVKRLPSSDTHPALVALFDLIQNANNQRRELVDADLANLEDTKGVEKLRSLLQDQFQALDEIRTKIKEGEKGYMSLDDLRSKYIACKVQAKNQVNLLQRSKVAIPPSIVRVVQPNTNFGVWSKALNSRLSLED